MRLLSRWDDKVEDKWLTMAVPANEGGSGVDAALADRDSDRAVLAGGEVQRGRQVDMANLVARNPREKEGGRKGAPVTITFKSVRGEWPCVFLGLDLAFSAASAAFSHGGSVPKPTTPGIQGSRGGAAVGGGGPPTASTDTAGCSRNPSPSTQPPSSTLTYCY